MDGFLPFVGTRPVPAGIGSLDPPKNSGLLLETVAQRPDQGAGADEARHQEADSDPGGDEPEVLLATVKDVGHPNRTDKRLAEETRATVVKRDVGVVPLSVGNEGRYDFRNDGLTRILQ